MEESRRQPSLPKEVFPPRRRDAPIFQRAKHRVSISSINEQSSSPVIAAASSSSPTISPHANHKDNIRLLSEDGNGEGSPIARSEGGMSSAGLQMSPSPSPPSNNTNMARGVSVGDGDTTPVVELGRRSGSFRSRRHSQLLDAKDADAAFSRSSNVASLRQSAATSLRRVESLCTALRHCPSPPISTTTTTDVVTIPTAASSSMMLLEDVADVVGTTHQKEASSPIVVIPHQHPTVSLLPLPSKENTIVCLLCLHSLPTTSSSLLYATSSSRTSQCTCSVPIPFPMAGGDLTPFDHDAISTRNHHNQDDDTATAMCPTCRSSVTRCPTDTTSSSVCPSCYTQYCWSCEQWGDCLCGSSRSWNTTTAATHQPKQPVTYDVCTSWSSCRFCGEDCTNVNGSLIVQDMDGSVSDATLLVMGDAAAAEDDILVPDLSAAAGGGVELNLNPRQEQYVRDNRARTSNWTFTEEESSSVNAVNIGSDGVLPLDAAASGSLSSSVVPSISNAAREEGVDEEGNIRVRMAAFFSSIARGVFGNGTNSSTSNRNQSDTDEVSEGDLSIHHNNHNSTALVAITTSPPTATTTLSQQHNVAVVGHTTRNMWGYDDEDTVQCTSAQQHHHTTPSKEVHSSFKRLFTATSGVAPPTTASTTVQQQRPQSFAVVKDCCKSVACQHQARSVCGRTLPCGHPCYGTPHITSPLPTTNSSQLLPPDAHLHVRPCMPCLQEGCPAHGLTGKALLLKLKDLQLPLPSKAIRRLILSQGYTTPNSNNIGVVSSSSSPSRFLTLPSSTPPHQKLLPIVNMPPTRQTSDDSCCICYTDPLMGRGCIQLASCGHVLHLDCVLERLKHRWPSKRISFNYLCCPICNVEMQSRVLEEVMRPHLAFKGYITTMILSRIEAEGLKKCAALTTPTSEYYHNPVAYGMRFLSFYTCHKCVCPYFGGFNWCDAVLPPEGAAVENEGDDDWEGGDGRGGGVVAGAGAAQAGGGAVSVKDIEYCCNDCTVGKGKSNCVVHGKHFIQYKCRFCCSVARWFCWGTTRFCNECHTAQTGGNYLNKKRPFELPQCGSYWNSAPLIEGMEKAPPKVPMVPLTDVPSLDAKMQLLRTIHSRRYSSVDGGEGAETTTTSTTSIPLTSAIASSSLVPVSGGNSHQQSSTTSVVTSIQHRALMELRSAGLLRILVELSSNHTRPTQPSTTCSSLGVVHPPNGAGEFCLGCSLCATVE